MSCKISILRTILAILNAVLSILGIGLIALSVFELNTSTPGTIEHIAIVVQIFIGSFVILTSFLGCFGVCRGSLGLTWSYAICMIILLAFQIYIIIAAHSTDYQQNATDDFNTIWNNSTSINFARIEEIEQKYNCCGKIGSQDYILMDRGIPKNCYKNFDRMTEHLFSAGCLSAVQQDAVRSGSIGLTIKWILFFFELLTLGFAGLMGITLRNKQRREQFEN